MKSLKRTVMFTVIALACAGVYGAVRNLPVVSGCNFYNDCPNTVGVATTTHANQVNASRGDQHD